MHHAGMQTYARMCGWTLAHAHARTGDPIAIAGYLGSNSHFDKAMTRFADTEATQNAHDHDAVRAGVDAGRLDVALA